MELRLRPNKGKSLVAFPSDFTVVDLETTGLSPYYDDIIEISCIRVRNLKAIDSFSSLVNPGYEIDEYITDLTGITNEMLSPAPAISAVLPDALSFIGSDIVVAHNAHFDVNFLYDASERLGISFSNDLIDTMRLSRKMFPSLDHHRLCDMAAYFSIPVEVSHRALADCETTLCLYNHLLEIAGAENLDEYVKQLNRKKRSVYYNSVHEMVAANPEDIDPSHPLFDKLVAVTGKLAKMTHKEAGQIVTNFGGHYSDDFNKDINYLVLGDNSMCDRIKDGKSRKQKKAEACILKGSDMQIITELDFYDLINQD